MHYLATFLAAALLTDRLHGLPAESDGARFKKSSPHSSIICVRVQSDHQPRVTFDAHQLAEKYAQDLQTRTLHTTKNVRLDQGDPILGVTNTAGVLTYGELIAKASKQAKELGVSPPRVKDGDSRPRTGASEDRADAGAFEHKPDHGRQGRQVFGFM